MTLPQELIDKIISASGVETQVELYKAHLLQTVVSPELFLVLECDILTYFQMKHRHLLNQTLSCLKYHVWDDGTPMKNRQVHKTKLSILNLFRAS